MPMPWAPDSWATCVLVPLATRGTRTDERDRLAEASREPGGARAPVPTGYEWTTHLSEQQASDFLVRSIQSIRRDRPWVGAIFIWNLNFRTFQDYHTRETAIFGGAPIAAYHDQLKCGVGVIDLNTGNTVATLQFATGVEEIFDVQVVPGARCPTFGGLPGEGEEIWLLPGEPDADPGGR